MKKNSQKNSVRAAIDNATDAGASKVDYQHGMAGADQILKKYLLKETGLYILKDGSEYWLSDRFDLIAETQDESRYWGVQLQWRNRDGELESEVFRRQELQNDAREVRQRLAAGGLAQNADPWSRQKLIEYLNAIYSKNRARCVITTGWHIINEKRIFVLPSQVIGEAGIGVILQSITQDRAPFRCKGTLENWRATVSRWAIFNSRLIFSISIALAGPLLDLVGEDGGGFNLKGPSRVGKTTALRIAASVWGGDSLQGSSAFIKSWRSTGNGLEGVATQYSDAFLPLDEMGQVDAKDIGDVAYMLANGSGKSRAGRDGSARTPARWRVLFLSTGEVGLQDKNIEAKVNTKAGQIVRLIDVQADAGKGFGLYEDLHGELSPDIFADLLRQACKENFGVAGIAWLEWIIDHLEIDDQFRSKIQSKIEILLCEWLKDFPEAGGQVRSVGRRYALIAVAGELATQAGITGWSKNDAHFAVGSLFKGWLAERGTTGSSEDLQARRQLSEFISRHGASRFELWQKATLRQDDDGTIVKDEPIVERIKTVNSAGWRRLEETAVGKQGWMYYLTDAGMRDALQGLDFRPAVKALGDQGMIIRDNSGKSTLSREPPGTGKAVRLYAVPGHVIGENHNTE